MWWWGWSSFGDLINYLFVFEANYFWLLYCVCRIILHLANLRVLYF
jgi:hypothetical protein